MVAGFANAPVTKGCLIVIPILSILTSLFQLTPFVHLQIHPHLTVHYQFYRLILQHFAFTSSSELFLALLLFYNAGVKVERTFGTYKFASFLLFTTTIYTLAQLFLLGLCSFFLTGYTTVHDTERTLDLAKEQASKSWLAKGVAPAGPWGPLFVILDQYHYIIPHLWSIEVGPLTITDQHITITSLGMLVAFSQSGCTLFASIVGICVSMLYRSSIPPFSKLKQYRIPLRLYTIISLMILPWIGQTRLPQRSWRAEPPERRTLQARQARLAEHNAAVANLNRSTRGLHMPTIASLLRRRGSTAPTPQEQGQGQPGIVRQMSPPPPPTTTTTTTTTAAAAASGQVRVGWNDVASD
ncbi:uncharacterized protein MEPE_05707 [Melanopsichium pennsylvanicum]|uniref:Peptidase S54 rhomboid domain-containing protein n=1 Tax=Melanopsichium pennsylvanicum TaxID=63383 RepID=A0AAJ5C7X5_9BASI|nr:uncharacterized protein MEPE_05707 [Melanopsichium pennsylvanicum]